MTEGLLLRFVSWNIAGGRRVHSRQNFAYSGEDLAYFTNQLKKVEAEVVCLQETHTNHVRSLAKVIAKELGYYQVFDYRMSASHIDPAYQLAMAILTKHEFQSPSVHFYPQPQGELRFPDGRIADKHRKGLQILNYQGIWVANTHWISLLNFGHDYREGAGRRLIYAVEEIMANHLTLPLVLCGDFNVESELGQLLARLLTKFHLVDALPTEPTYFLPSKIDPIRINAPDHIYLSTNSLRTEASGVIRTETDHYLCWADIAVRGKP